MKYHLDPVWLFYYRFKNLDVINTLPSFLSEIVMLWNWYVLYFSTHFCVGQIGYALVPMVARGIMLGADQPVILHMLDIPPAAEALNGVKMELVDAAFPLLKGTISCGL